MSNQIIDLATLFLMLVCGAVLGWLLSQHASRTAPICLTQEVHQITEHVVNGPFLNVRGKIDHEIGRVTFFEEVELCEGDPRPRYRYSYGGRRIK